MMDGVRKYVVETGKQGGQIATICSVASDASIREAVRSSRDTDVALIVDLYAALNVAERASQMEAMGVDSVYVHWGADQKNENPERDPLIDLPGVVERVKIPVGVGTFSVAHGVRAFKMGASIGVIGMPLIQLPDVEGALREYVELSKSAYQGDRG
jgi:3-hexulose-6-phosphate synthase